jgi:serine phosphatase RsbU (regulator of sigma subunit)
LPASPLSIARFALRERALLDHTALNLPVPPGALLELLDADGQRLWSAAAGSRTPPRPSSVNRVLAEIDLAVEEARVGSLRLRYGGADGSPLDPDSLKVLETIGELLEGCLRREFELQGLIEEHVATTDQLIAMYNVTRKTRGQWHLETKLTTILEEAIRVTGATTGYLSLPQAGHRVVLVPRRAPADGRLGRRLLDDAERHDVGRVELLDPADHGGPDAPSSYVAAPFPVGDDARGWILLIAQGEPFTSGDLKLLESIADLAGGFVQNAVLQDQLLSSIKTQQEMEIAVSIQRSLVPDRFDAAELGSHLAGVDLSASCRPASRVGGDFYVVKPAADGSVLFAAGDVSGKGVGALVLMSMIRTGVLALNQVETSPARILEELNRYVTPELESATKFVTLVVARYHPRWGRLEFANAGHAPVLHVSREKGAVELAPDATPIGILDDLEVQNRSLVLGDGDAFCVMSDGYPDACSPGGRRLGIETLRGQIEELRPRSAREIVDALVDTVRDHGADAPQADDQTVVVLKRGETL